MWIIQSPFCFVCSLSSLVKSTPILLKKKKVLPTPLSSQMGSLPNASPESYSQFIFDKRAKDLQRRKDSLCNKQCWENWITTQKRMKLGFYLMPYIKINSKWIKDINISPETVKLLEGSTAGETQILTLVLAIIFWTWHQSTSNKSKNTQVWLNQTKSICTVKETNKMKRHLWNGRKYLQTRYLIRG